MPYVMYIIIHVHACIRVGTLDGIFSF